MQAAERRPVAIRWDFLGLFVLYVGMFVVLAEMNRNSMLAFREFTASAMTTLCGIFSVPAACSGTQMTFAGFRMDIVLECTALHYMIIFVAGVLAFRAHDLPYRAAGVIIGTLAIFLLNIARIGAVGFIGRYYSSIFAFVHDYLWQGTFALCVVLLWVLWVNGKGFSSHRLITRFLIVVVSASFSFWLAAALLEEYVFLLASLSNLIFRPLSLIADVPQDVIADGRLIGYVAGSEVTYSDTPLYFLNAALLLPIASITFVRSQWRTFSKRLGLAVLLLVAQHLLVIALDWLLEIAGSPGLQSPLIWVIVMVTFISPMLVWLAVMNIFRNHPASDNSAPPS